MDEPTQPYHEARALLADLVASWPWDRPGTAFENAKVYLDFHCADCGAKLSVNDLAVVLELEMLRHGAVDARRMPYFDPICVRCYLRRAAPVCHFASRRVDNAMWGVARSDSGTCRTDNGSLPAPTNTTTLTERLPVPLESTPPPHPAQPTLDRPQRAWWWQPAGACVLVVAVLLIVLAFGMALNSFLPGLRTSTLTRPPAPAVTTTAVLTSLSGQASFGIGIRRARATDQSTSISGGIEAV